MSNYAGDFVFGNSKEECLEKLKFFESDKAKHAPVLAPSYEKYFEYLKSIVDKNGYLPKVEETATYYNRAPSTIIGWNKHIPEIKLDKFHNRLMLEGYSNPHIEYDIEEFNKKKSKLYSIFIISENKTIIVRGTKEGGEYFGITAKTFSKLIYRVTPYKNNYIIRRADDI